MKNINIKRSSSDKINKFAKKHWSIVNKRFNLLPNPKSFFFSINLRNKLIGYSKIDVRGETTEIRDFLIQNEFTNKGIGSETIKYIEKFAQRNKCKKLLVKVPVVFKRTIKFYRKHGFKKDIVLQKYYYNRDWHYMIKEL